MWKALLVSLEEVCVSVCHLTTRQPTSGNKSQCERLDLSETGVGAAGHPATLQQLCSLGFMLIMWASGGGIREEFLSLLSESVGSPRCSPEASCYWLPPLLNIVERHLTWYEGCVFINREAVRNDDCCHLHAFTTVFFVLLIGAQYLQSGLVL